MVDKESVDKEKVNKRINSELDSGYKLNGREINSCIKQNGGTVDKPL